MNSETDSLDGVLKLLKFRQKHDLAQLLERAWLELDESNQYGSYLFSTLTTARIHAPIDDYHRLRALPSSAKDEVLNTLLEIYPPRDHSIELTGVEFVVDTSAPADKHKELLDEIEAQRSLMIAVATGGPRIQQVNLEYQERRQRIATTLAELDIPDPNPYSDLWAWYGKWSSGDLPSYNSRRQFISNLYSPLIDALKRGAAPRQSGVFREPTGWDKVDRTLSEIRHKLLVCCAVKVSFHWRRLSMTQRDIEFLMMSKLALLMQSGCWTLISQQNYLEVKTR